MKTRNERKSFAAAALLGLALSACAQVDPAADFESAQRMIAASTGEAEVFDPSLPALTEAELDAILAEGLTLEEALSLALTNQRDLQASFHEIGIAHADWVQSKLLTNPSLDMLFRFASGSGGGDVLEATAGLELMQLWRLSARIESASTNLDATILQIARRAGEYLTTARKAYFEAVAAQELFHVAQENVALAGDLANAVNTLHTAGSADALALSLAQGPLLSAELAVRTARIDAAESKRTLAQALSLTRSVENLELSSALPSPTFLNDSADELVAQAWEQRLDLRAIDKTLEALAAQVRVEQKKAWGSVELGASYESTDGEDGALLGPALNLEIPLFDQNQAQVARAQSRWEQMRKLQGAARVAVAQEVRSQLDRVQSSAQDLAFYHERVLPQAKHSLELASESYSAGRIDLTALVEVQRQLLEVRRGLVTLRLESATSFAALELAVGSPLAGPVAVEE